MAKKVSEVKTMKKGTGVNKCVPIDEELNKRIEEYCKRNNWSFTNFARLAFELMLDIEVNKVVKEAIAPRHYRITDGELMKD